MIADISTVAQIRLKGHDLCLSRKVMIVYCLVSAELSYRVDITLHWLPGVFKESSVAGYLMILLAARSYENTILPLHIMVMLGSLLLWIILFRCAMQALSSAQSSTSPVVPPAWISFLLEVFEGPRIYDESLTPKYTIGIKSSNRGSQHVSLPYQKQCLKNAMQTPPFSAVPFPLQTTPIQNPKNALFQKIIVPYLRVQNLEWPIELSRKRHVYQ